MINRCTSQLRRIINIISYGACHFYLTGRNTEANLCTCKMCLAYSQICKSRAHSYLIFCGSAFFPFVLQIIVLCLVWLLLIIIPSCWIQFQILSGDSFVCASVKRCDSQQRNIRRENGYFPHLFILCICLPLLKHNKEGKD